MILCCAVFGLAEQTPRAGGVTVERLVVRGLSGRAGGRLVYGERSEPKTLNPIFAAETPSRNVINRLMADLIHINRSTFQTEPALAKSWKVSADGLRYEVVLRDGLRFSDGHACDADDVVFSFQVYLDEQVNSPQRSFWILDGKAVAVRKLDRLRVAFELPRASAVGDRMFDGVAILPRHLLEGPYREGRLDKVWGVRTPAAEIAGLGPFRLKEFAPGQRLVLERNPYYWKTDSAGASLPYLSELVYAFAAGEDMQILRFQAGESDVISRIAPKDYAVLQRDSGRRGYTMADAGPGMEYSFMVFNLNASAPANAVWRRQAFRRAVAAAIDRDAVVKLVYQSYADPLASFVPAGNRPWISGKLARPAKSVEKAREYLAADGFKWTRDGGLLDPDGKAVRFSILVSATNNERMQIATLMQADLKAVGIQLDLVPLEFASLVDRLTKKKDFESAIFAISSADADPNVEMALLLSSGSSHLWNPGQKEPATAWEAEIDGLMKKQMVTRRVEDRRRMYERVQELVMEHLPLIPLVTPHILAGAKNGLGNFRPAILEPYALWNVEELYWRGPGGGARR